jgi:hypothetical protein
VTAENIEESLRAHASPEYPVQGPDYGLLSHNGEYRDDVPADKIHPSFPGHFEIDLEDLYSRMDGVGLTNVQNSPGPAVRDRAAAVRMLLDWLFDVNLEDHRALKVIGVRAVAFAWVIDPKRFNDASLTTIAKALGYKGCNSIAPAAADFARVFGIKNQFQRAHDWKNN